MGWKTSKAFVSSKERIARIEYIPLIFGIQTTGAEARYMTKDDFPELAGLTEGGFAIDIYLKKDKEKRKMLTSPGGASSQSGNEDEDIDMSDRKSGNSSDSAVPEGVLADGKSISELKEALKNLDGDNNIIIFWYNGKWNIVKNEKNGDEYIPVELAKKVTESGGFSSNYSRK